MVFRRWGRYGVCSKLPLLLLGCKKENVTSVTLKDAPDYGVEEVRETDSER